MSVVCTGLAFWAHSHPCVLRLPQYITGEHLGLEVIEYLIVMLTCMLHLENQVDNIFNNPSHGKFLRATQSVLEEALAIAKGLSHPLTRPPK